MDEIFGTHRVYIPQSGHISVLGNEVTGLRPHRIAAAGVARTFQGADFFAEMPVIDFLLLSRLRYQATSLTGSILGLPRVRRSERGERARALGMLHRLELRDLADHPVGGLPYGVRKLLDVGRALLTEPQLLLMDEPTSGTSTADREALRHIAREIHNEGVTIVIVDHDVSFIADVTDRLLAMNFGKAIGVGTPAEVLARQDVLEAYVGLEPETEPSLNARDPAVVSDQDREEPAS